MQFSSNPSTSAAKHTQQQVEPPGKLKKFKKKAGDDTPSAGQLFVHAGLPMIIFSLLGVWVLKNSIEGKNKEYDASKGKVSK